MGVKINRWRALKRGIVIKLPPVSYFYHIRLINALPLRTALFATVFLLLISLFELSLIATWAGPALGLPMPEVQEQLLNGLPEERNEHTSEKEHNAEYLQPPASLSLHTISAGNRDNFFNSGSILAPHYYQPVWVPPPRRVHSG